MANPVDMVVPGLYIGGQAGACNLQVLKQNGITHIVARLFATMRTHLWMPLACALCAVGHGAVARLRLKVRVGVRVYVGLRVQLRVKVIMGMWVVHLR